MCAQPYWRVNPSTCVVLGITESNAFLTPYLASPSNHLHALSSRANARLPTWLSTQSKATVAAIPKAKRRRSAA